MPTGAEGAADGLRIGLLGKVPAHGDFIRRGTLPPAFCAAWDSWLQEGIAAARAALGEARWEAAWDAAPAWRFALPAGACGPEAAAGVLVPSRDAVGRRWPLTLAAVAADPGRRWPADWFAALEGTARRGLAEGADADTLAEAIPYPFRLPTDPGPVLAASGGDSDPLAGFWAGLEAGSPADTGAVPDARPAEDPSPPVADPAMMATGDGAVAPGSGWWTAASASGAPGLVWPLAALPEVTEFVLLVEADP